MIDIKFFKQHSLRILSIGILSTCLLGVSLYGRQDDTASSYRACDIEVKGTCFYNFDSTMAVTDDSDPFSTKTCDFVSWRIDGDGTASIIMQECSGLDDATTCTVADTSVLTCDVDADGLITAVDEANAWDGTTGNRGCTMVTPVGWWAYVDVQTVPASGSARVTIRCHKFHD